MSRREILVTRYGEMLDMMACYAIFRGAEPKRRKMSFDDALRME